MLQENWFMDLAVPRVMADAFGKLGELITSSNLRCEFPLALQVFRVHP